MRKWRDELIGCMICVILIAYLSVIFSVFLVVKEPLYRFLYGPPYPEGTYKLVDVNGYYVITTKDWSGNFYYSYYAENDTEPNEVSIGETEFVYDGKNIVEVKKVRTDNKNVLEGPLWKNKYVFHIDSKGLEKIL